MNLPDPVNDAVDEAKKKAEDVLHSDQVQGAEKKTDEMADKAGDAFNQAKENVQDKVDDWREQHK